jgi:chromosome segregation ATPase
VLSEISKLTKRKSELELMMGRLTPSVNEKKQRKRNVHSTIISCEFEKQKLISRINFINDFLKRCQSLALSASETSIDRVEVQRYTLKIEMKMSKLMDAITKLKSKHIEYEEVVSRVETLLCELKEIKLVYNLDLDADSGSRELI